MDPQADLKRLQKLFEPRLVPGSDYLRALNDLGLDPDALFWADEFPGDKPVLVLITAFFDHAGPLEVEKALFKAYNAAATPAEIDPFIIRLHSPRQTFAREVIGAFRRDIEVETDMQPRTHISKIPNTVMTIGDLKIPMFGVLKMPTAVRKTVEVSRSWQRFTSNIDKLAA